MEAVSSLAGMSLEAVSSLAGERMEELSSLVETFVEYSLSLDVFTLIFIRSSKLSSILEYKNKINKLLNK